MARLLASLFFLLLLVDVSRAVTSPLEEYWHSVLPNARMPKTIRDVIYTDPNEVLRNMDEKIREYYVIYREKADKSAVSMATMSDGGEDKKTKSDARDPSVTVFFLEKDLKAGAKMKLQFSRSSYSTTFLPRRDADSIPFSSSRLPEILSHFSIDPKSAMAKAMRRTLDDCEVPAGYGERVCATSLESMVDFSMSTFGTNHVEAVSTLLSNEEDKPHVFAIAPGGIRRLPGEELVVCHAEAYRYAVFYCHVATARGYAVQLVGEDGTKAVAVAACHTNTESWNPNHESFMALHVKPGTVPICHFLPQDHVVWSRSKEDTRHPSMPHYVL